MNLYNQYCSILNAAATNLRAMRRALEEDADIDAARAFATPQFLALRIEVARVQEILDEAKAAAQASLDANAKPKL
jgi:hypothetical protein